VGVHGADAVRAGGEIAGGRGRLLNTDCCPGGGGELNGSAFDEEEGHVPLSVVVLKEGGREGGRDGRREEGA